MRALVRLFMRIYYCFIKYHVKFFNSKKVKEIDKCIICPNHSNKDEPTWIYADIPNLCIMAKAELFEKKIVAKALTYFNVFPIKRGEKDVKSLMHAINLFKNTSKRKLLIFPEGERIKKEMEKGDAKVGPIYIAIKAGVPIVPTYISKNVDKFSKVNVIYGEPIYYSSDLIKNKEKLKEASDELLNTIYSLNKETQA